MSESRVKVLRVISRLNVGGPAIHVVNLNAGLDPYRFECLLVTGTENPGEGSMLDYALSRGVQPIVVPEIVGEAAFKPRDVKALLKLYNLIRRERPTIVHTHTAKAGFLGRLAGRLAGVPVIIHTFHGHVLRGYYSPLMTWLLRRMERAMGRLSDQIVAVSPQVKSELVAYGVAAPEKICVIPLGLDLQPFLDCQAQRGELRRELSLDDRTRLVGIVGRIFPIKNHRLFLEAAARVAAQTPDVRFLVVGDGILRPEMEAHARRLGIGEKVLFTGWRRDLPRIYADLDLLAVSSDNEGTPVSAIEAMASGCPVVATRVGGVPDLVKEEETGILVPPQNAQAMAEAIMRLLANPDLRSRMGLKGRASAQGRFALQRLISDTEALYCQVLARKGITI